MKHRVSGLLTRALVFTTLVLLALFTSSSLFSIVSFEKDSQARPRSSQFTTDKYFEPEKCRYHFDMHAQAFSKGYSACRYAAEALMLGMFEVGTQCGGP